MQIIRKNSQMRILLLSNALNMMGSVMFNIVFLVYAQGLPYKNLAITLVSIANFLPILFDIPAGFLADQTHNRLHHIVWVHLAQFGLYMLLAALIGFSTAFPIFVILLLINIVSDVFSSYMSGLVMPLIKHFVPAEQLNSANGLMSAIDNTISVVFVGVGAGLIVALHNNFVLFGIINAVTFLGAGLILFLERTLFVTGDNKQSASDEQVRVKSKKQFWSGMKDSLGWLTQQKVLFMLMCLALIVNMAGMSLEPLVSLQFANDKSMWLFNNFGNTIAIISILSSIGTISGSLFMHDGLQKVSTATIIAGTISVMTLFGINMVWVRSAWLTPILQFLMGYSIGKVNPRISTVIMQLTPEGKLATISNTISTFVMIGGPLSSVIFLGIANLVSIQVSWFSFIIFCLFALGFAFYATIFIKRFENDQEEEKII